MLAVQIVNLPTLRPPASVRLQGPDRQQNVSVGIARPFVVDGKVGAHPSVNKIVFDKSPDKGQLLCGGQLHRKGNFDLAGKLGIAGFLNLLHGVPEGGAVLKFRRGVGGQHDFVYGSSLSEGGMSFIAMLATTNKGLNKIKPVLTPGAGVVTTRFQTHWIVTEYGAVNLRGKNLAERAKLMISVAAPQFREELEREAAERFGYSFLRLK